MLRTVSPKSGDQLKRLAQPTWRLIERRGAFFEADTGDILLDAGESDDHLLIVLSGMATLLYPSGDEFVRTAIYRRRGELLHHAGMHLKAKNPFQISAAMDGTRAVLINRDSIYDLIARDVTFAEFLFKELSARLLLSLDYLRQEREDPLILRLAKRLLDMAYDDTVVEFTQSEIAEIMAVTRISISKSLKTLEELGLVKRSQRSLITVNRGRLSEWVVAQS